MGVIANALAEAFRDFTTEGVPSSGAHRPRKADIRNVGALIDSLIGAIAAGVVRYETVAAMTAVTSSGPGQLAYVWKNNGDSADAANGYYQWDVSAWVVADWVMNLIADPAGAYVDGLGNYFDGEAGNHSLSGTGNTALGQEAGGALAAGSLNFLGGYRSGNAFTTASYNVVLQSGGNAGTDWQYCVAIGDEAMRSGVGTGMIGSIAIGRRALKASSASECVGIGYNVALNSTGGRITAVGDSAGTANTTGFSNTYLGYDAGGVGGIQSATIYNSTMLGNGARSAAENRVVLGNAAVEDVYVGTTAMYRYQLAQRNYYFGNAGNRLTTNAGCIGIGETALALGNGLFNAVAIGDLAMSSHVAGNGCTALGSRALMSSTGCIDTTMVGNRAGAFMLTGVGSTGIGLRALEFATQARSTTAVGDSAFWLHQGGGGVALGYRAAEYTLTGTGSIYVGIAAGTNRSNGDYCVFVGSEAGGFDGVTPDPVTGVGAITAGDRVIGVGQRAMSKTTGSDHVGVGDQAGYSITGGSGCVMLGSGAGKNGSQKVDAVNSIAIGKDAYATADNQAVLGNSSITQTVLNGKVGIGLGLTAPSGNLHVKSAAGGDIATFERQFDTANQMVNTFRVRATKATDMADGYGVSISLQIRDDAAVDNALATIGAIRDGADNTGQIQLRAHTGGVLQDTMIAKGSKIVAAFTTTMTAGGAPNAGLHMSATNNFGVHFGSGAPTISAAKGSIYLRSDGTGPNSRVYVNTDGSTAWVPLLTPESTTVAALPAVGTVPVGGKHFVTDANVTAAGNFGAIVAGGGANKVPVYSDGTNWRIG